MTTQNTYPDVKIQIPVGHGLDVKPDGRNGSDDFTNLKAHVVSIHVGIPP